MDKRAIRQFIYWEKASRDTIDFKKSYVDLSGDLIAGLLLSQIVYWHLPNNEGKTKLRVRHEGKLWIAKSRNDWWEEIRITAKQFDRASTILVGKKLIEKKTFKFNGSPMIHVRIIWENFIPLWEKTVFPEDDSQTFDDDFSQSEDEGEEDREKGSPGPYSPMVIPQRGRSKLPKGEDGNYPKGKMDIDQRGRSLTENTTEIPSENNTKNPYQYLSDYLYQSKLPMRLKKFFADRVSVLVNKFPSFDVEKIEYVYNTYTEWIQPDASRDNEWLLNEIEFTDMIIQLYKTLSGEKVAPDGTELIDEINPKPIKSMEGLILKWIERGLEFKAQRKANVQAFLVEDEEEEEEQPIFDFSRRKIL